MWKEFRRRRNSVKRFHCAFVLCCFNTPQIISPNSCLHFSRLFLSVSSLCFAFFCYLGSSVVERFYICGILFLPPFSWSRNLIIFNFNILSPFHLSIYFNETFLVVWRNRPLNRLTNKHPERKWMEKFPRRLKQRSKNLSHEKLSSNLISLLTSERKLMENILSDFKCFQDANDQVNRNEKVTKLCLINSLSMSLKLWVVMKWKKNNFIHVPSKRSRFDCLHLICGNFLKPKHKNS